MMSQQAGSDNFSSIISKAGISFNEKDHPYLNHDPGLALYLLQGALDSEDCCRDFLDGFSHYIQEQEALRKLLLPCHTNSNSLIYSY